MFTAIFYFFSILGFIHFSLYIYVRLFFNSIIANICIGLVITGILIYYGLFFWYFIKEIWKKIYRKFTRQYEKEFFKKFFLQDDLPIPKELFYYTSNQWNEFEQKLIAFENNKKNLYACGDFNLTNKEKYYKKVMDRFNFLVSKNLIQKPSDFPIEGYTLGAGDEWIEFKDKKWGPNIFDKMLYKCNVEGFTIINSILLALSYIWVQLKQNGFYYQLIFVIVFYYDHIFDIMKGPKSQKEEDINIHKIQCLTLLTILGEILIRICNYIMDKTVFA